MVIYTICEIVYGTRIEKKIVPYVLSIATRQNTLSLWEIE